MNRAGWARRNHGTADEDAAADKHQTCATLQEVGQSLDFGSPEPRSAMSTQALQRCAGPVREQYTATEPRRTRQDARSKSD
jgi:hypothetical protein